MGLLDAVDDEPERRPPPASFSQEVVDSLQGLFPAGGAMLGGVFGSALGPLGMIGGAGLGGEFGARTARLGQSIADLLVPVPGPATQLGREMAAPTSLTGELGRSAQTIGLGMAGEMGGQMFGRALQGVTQGLNRLRPAITPDARAVQAQLQTAGSRLTPSQLTESRGIDIAEGIAQGALFGGPIDLVKKGQTRAIQSLTDHFAASLDTTLGERGISAFLKDAVGDKRIFGRALQRLAYKEVDAAAGTVRVATDAIAEFIDESAAAGRPQIRKALLAAGLSPKMFERGGRPASPGAAPYQVPVAPSVSFSEAAAMRSALLRVSRKRPIAPEDEAITRTAGHLASKMDAAITASASRLAPEAMTAFRQANDLTARLEQTVNNEAVRSVIRRLSKEPAKLTQVLVRPNNVDVLEAVERAIPGAWPTVQRELATRTLLKAVDPTRGNVLNGAALLRRLTALGPETLDAAFGRETAIGLKRLADSARFVEATATPAEQSGGLVVKMAQGGAIVAFGLSPFIGFSSTQAALGAGLTLAGPWSLSKLLASPKALSILAEGLQPNLSIQQAGKIAAQLAAYRTDGPAPERRANELAPSAPVSLLDQIQ
ncbi:MAG: hypothetical protein HY323_14425 [Betaproteobacteria bacterium]|nr:hypothetical protein [Betaproteobacteria bacterium]